MAFLAGAAATRTFAEDRLIPINVTKPLTAIRLPWRQRTVVEVNAAGPAWTNLKDLLRILSQEFIEAT
jgi:hypothetical protein